MTRVGVVGAAGTVGQAVVTGAQPCPGSVPVYGASKLLGETLARGISHRVCCLRMSDAFGRGTNREASLPTSREDRPYA